MEENELLAKVGNFVVARVCGGGLGFVSVKSVSGTWEVRFREDSQMYGTLVLVCRRDDFRPYLEAYVHALYLLGNTTPDLEFLDAFYLAYNGFSGRNTGKPTPEEKDAAILAEMKRAEEMGREAAGAGD